MTHLACSLHHDRFAAEYLIDTNAAKAAMRGGLQPGNGEAPRSATVSDAWYSHAHQ